MLYHWHLQPTPHSLGARRSSDRATLTINLVVHNFGKARRNTMILVKRILLFSLVAVDLIAQSPQVQSKYKPEYFTFQEIMIPMRDGVRLQTVIRADRKSTRLN